MRHSIRWALGFALCLMLGLPGPDRARAADDLNADYAKAIQLANAGDFQNALQITDKLMSKRRGQKEAADGAIHDLHGACLINTGQGAKAVEALEEGARIFEGLKASEQQGYGNLLMNLNIAYRLCGKPEAGEKVLLKLLEMAKKPRAEKPMWMVQRDLAYLYCDTKQVDKAAAMISEAVRNFNSAAGPKSPTDEFTLLEAQADCLSRAGKLEESLAAAIKLVPIARRVFPATDRNLANALYSQGMGYMRLQRRKEAKEPMLEAVRIYQNLPQTDDPASFATLVGALTSLAWIHMDFNELREADAAVQRARAIVDKRPNTSVENLNDLYQCAAQLYSTMRDMPKALAFAEQRVAVNEKAYGKDHPDTVSARKALATAYESAGKGDAAAKIRETTSTAPAAADQDRFQDLFHEGWDLHGKRDYAGAEKVFTQLYQFVLKEHGPDHPGVATALIGLLNTSHAKNETEKAATIYARLSAFIKGHEKIMDTQVAADSYYVLATIAHRLNKADEAKVWAAKWYTSYAALLDGVLAVGTQEQRLEFTSYWRPYGLFIDLNDSRALASMVLRLKGVVMDSLLEERQQAILSKDPKHREMFAELTRLKEQYRKASFVAGPEGQKQADAIRARLDAAEQGMAGIGATAGTTRRALRVRVEDVQARLPAGAMLVEFIHYLDNLRQGRYGAVLIPSSGQAQWVPIGSANELDRTIEIYKFISNHIGHPQMMEGASKQLYLKLWEPIAKYFPAGTKRVVISPDGELCFVSFATLLDAKNQFLCETYDMQYVASGRDLLRHPYKDEMDRSKDTLTIYADPAYLNKADVNSGPRWMSQLPGARQEGEILKQLVEGWKWKAELLLDEQATEDAIRTKQAPRILHLSTHGFYFDHMPHPGKKGQEANPMLKSGLALAGAESTFRKWRAGKVDDPSQDGILMADELGDLNLRGTWLVCLSACQTASGEAKSGEGVMGLRRGFVEAGAQHLISTLWPIPDEQTVPIMKDFYVRVNATQDPPLALSQVQRDWLIKLRKEHNSAGAAIILSGAFIANSYGKPGT